VEIWGLRQNELSENITIMFLRKHLVILKFQKDKD